MHILNQPRAEPQDGPIALGEPSIDCEYYFHHHFHRYFHYYFHHANLFIPFAVLAPTRELAVQIGDVANKYGRGAGINSVVLYGGSARARQVDQLSRGASLVIATPGRLIDLLSTGCVQLHRCTYFVLDEGKICRPFE